jgi:hypothetical protein
MVWRASDSDHPHWLDHSVAGVALMLLPQQTERQVLALFEQDGPYYGAAVAGAALGLWLAFAGYTG